MALPPQFLDELRARLPASVVVGHRVRLVRRGREHIGLCPFHRERTPSFTVNDDKGFYHCFGCGAHGDIISFEMETAHLTFPEAVEKLAAQAGLEVPRPDPREMEAARQHAGILDINEAACHFFQRSLFMPSGRGGLDYLRRRGLDDEVIQTFRLGWAPSGVELQTALLGNGITEDQMIEAGLLRRLDSGAVVGYFRERVMFPITDRRGRVIAFGGRTLGDGQPKYMNSPETPVFHKGQVLYNLSRAREAAARGGEIIVAEGYMDVIALHRAGIPHSVAPLGTALTEAQIESLWRLSDEPVLCMDGDSAGQRAAARAADRALPLLKPGKSLRFVMLPMGRDPDDLLRDEGARSVCARLAVSRSLLDVLWDKALEGRSLDTPERRAGLEAHLEELVRHIGDRSVQQHYRQAFRDRQWNLFRQAGRRVAGKVRPAGAFSSRGGESQPRWAAPLPSAGGGMILAPPAPDAAEALRRRILMVTLITHPDLFDSVGERLGLLDFPEQSLDTLRGAVLLLLSRQSGLDFHGLRRQLHDEGFGDVLESLLASNVFLHAAFSRPVADSQAALDGWEHTFGLSRGRDLKVDIGRAVERLGDNPTPEALDVFIALKKHERASVED
ncbi:DNA primase [Haematospirillum jordaniae]|uniref:DNA primase n=1 Tax=Haematospirillum jordaniae TaxID=1549855 RepID=UPI0014331C9E|nr:DNA primase [Haematospirillum jordaniae]NKD45347.1 DNA primase [Haematospirillum jordaniae]NKD92530.1 DNA primase [Haematospirillum jordaniae]